MGVNAEMPDGSEVSIGEVNVEVSPKFWLKFEALLSKDDAAALKEFFRSRNIEFKSI